MSNCNPNAQKAIVASSASHSTAEPVVYTVKEVSILLRTNPAFVYRLIGLGLLPALKLGSIRVRKDALDAFLRRYEGHDLSDPNNIKALVKAG